VVEFKDKTYRLSEFVDIVKNKQERLEHYNPMYNYALYAIEAEVTCDLTIYVGEPVEVTDSDEEIYPEYATKNDMWYFCSDENIQDVVDLAVSQCPEVNTEQLITALAYYLEHDDFMNL
jgi:hypothetical protein